MRLYEEMLHLLFYHMGLYEYLKVKPTLKNQFIELLFFMLNRTYEFLFKCGTLLNEAKHIS